MPPSSRLVPFVWKTSIHLACPALIAADTNSVMSAFKTGQKRDKICAQIARKNSPKFLEFWVKKNLCKSQTRNFNWVSILSAIFVRKLSRMTSTIKFVRCASLKDPM